MPLSDRSRSLLAMLASDNDGETLNAARALKVSLKKDGMDFHDLGSVSARERIVYLERPCPVCSANARARNFQSGSDRLADIAWLAEQDWVFTPREAEFLESLNEWCQSREPTEKQASWLDSILAKVRKAKAA